MVLLKRFLEIHVGRMEAGKSFPCWNGWVWQWHHTCWNAIPYKAPFSLSFISALIQTKPDISERKKPVTSKKPLQATTLCIWNRAQRWLNISKLNVSTTESVNARPLIFLHRGDHKTLLIRDGFRSKWNFIKEWLERLSHKPGQLGASLLNLRTAETMNGHSADTPIEAQTMSHLS